MVLALNEAKKTSDNWEMFSIADEIASLSSSEACEGTYHLFFSITFFNIDRYLYTYHYNNLFLFTNIFM